MTKVIWSIRAIEELEQVLDYWLSRNKSNNYSNRIILATDDAIQLIKLHPSIGIETNHRKVKMRLVLNRFYLVYRNDEDMIEILKFWDCRQSPESNVYK